MGGLLKDGKCQSSLSQGFCELNQDHSKMSIAALVAGEDVLREEVLQLVPSSFTSLKGKMRIMSTSQGLQKIV